MKKNLLTLVVLLGHAALAQNNDWSLTRVAGTAVMDEVSPLTFRVANAATSLDPISSFSIGIPNGPYDINGATAPAGWRASVIDKKDRKITFLAINACSGPTIGLRPGQAANFEVRVVGMPQPTDVPNQAIDRRRTDVIDACALGRLFRPETGAWTWTLVGLSSRVTTSLRAMDVGDQVTVSLTVANGSIVTQSGVAPAAPTITGAATFALVSGPTPASVNGLPIDGVATFSWVYRATGRGSARFNASATNGTVSSPVATSTDVNVGVFPAAVLVSPTTIISGGTVALLVLPTNNTSSTLTNVLPSTPLLTPTGVAQGTLLTGPTPSTVPSLSSRSTTAFTSTFRVTGEPGSKLTFEARATAVDSTAALITSNPISTGEVRVQELTISPSPSAVLSASGATQISYTLANGSTLPITSVVLMTPDANLFRTPTAVAPPPGWTSSTVSTAPRGIRFDATPAAQLAAGASQTFTIAYASIGTVTATSPTAHRVHVIYSDLTTGRADGTVTVAINRPVPDVIIPVAVATPGRVHFTWSNPALHDGVLLLRAAGAPPNTAPSAGRRYPAGTTLGNAMVVFEDGLSFNTSFADSGLSNGLLYYYRLYNRDEFGLYSPGNVPATSPNNYLLVVTPGTTASDALWCSTTGLPSLQQPFTDLGQAIYQSTNGSFFTGNVITVGAPINGNEKWRPALTRGVVQARPTAQRLGGDTEPSLFVGDQLGYAYRISAATGAIAWTGNGGLALGEVIQAQSVVTLRAYTSTSFQARYPTDLAFFATRNSTNRSSNSVRGLRADTGAQLYSYQPGDLDQVTGAPLFDYLGNTLWVASLRTAGPSLRVLDVLNPAALPLLTVSDLGDIPTGVTRHGNVNQALVVDRNGVARGYSMATRTMAWQLNVGGPVTTPLVPYLTDFFASTSTGVQRFHIDTALGTVNPVWAAPTPMRLPTSVRIDAAAGKLYVGDADGFLRRLNLLTGAVEGSVKVSTVGGVSMPSLDNTAGLKRVYVGTADGRLCAYPPSF